MSVLYIAVPIAIAMGGLALIACVRCIRGGQYDDLEGASIRMLFDDEPAKPSASNSDVVGDAEERSAMESS